MNKFMSEAINEARSGIVSGHGGPFGCVIVRDDEIVGRGHNMVLKNNDSTAHGEIIAIRDACSRLRTFDLSGCVVYTTGEPCIMCLGAILWSNISKIYYGCNIDDNGRIGFRDDKFDKIISIDRHGMHESGFLQSVDRDSCLALFDEYTKKDVKKY